MSLPPSVQLVIVNATAKSFILIAQDATKVRCKGEVIRVNGCSAMHNADKVFLKSKVTVCSPQDLTEELLNNLKNQTVPRPKKPRPPREPREPTSKWVKYDKFYGQMRLTKWAEKQLVREGKGIAEDGLGNYIDGDNALQDCAYDLAMGHYDLDYAGVSERHIIREIAADLIYEGMYTVYKKFKAQGKKTSTKNENKDEEGSENEELEHAAR
jgi:hypothetical protein